MMVSLAPMAASQQALSPAPGKPLLRRTPYSAGTIRKFDDAGLEDSFRSTPSSPSKRARVSFNPTVEERVFDEYVPKGRSLDVVRLEVKKAIEAHNRGDDELYDAVVRRFSTGDEEAAEESEEEEEREMRAEMRTYVLALTTYVPLLGKGLDGLVKALLSCDWIGGEEGFVKAYVNFLGHLASAQGYTVRIILTMLVDRFLGIEASQGRLPDCPIITVNQLYSRVHIALKYLLRMIPAAGAQLPPIIEKKFPVTEDSKMVHITYIQNLLRLTEYAPELKSEVLAVIIDRLVKIDVEMQVDLDDLDDEAGVKIVQALSLKRHGRKGDTDNEDGYDDNESDAASVNSQESMDEEMRRIADIKESVEKMDAILDLMFTVYDPYFVNPNSPEALTMFSTMLGHFSNIILPTYRSRHTQFLLFHFAQASEVLVDNFAGTCVQLAFQKSRPSLLRQASAAYLASFVARGAMVKPSVVREVFELIGTHLDHIRIENELTCRGPDLQRYGTFYAMTQALLYIFCFRWRDLISSTTLLDDEDDPTAFLGQDLTWTPGIKETFSRTIYSSLNPLKVCSPLIVSEFAKIAHHLRFMYVYPLLETNKRIRLSQFSANLSNGALRDTGNAGNSESWHQLDAYFPFDPYQLPISKRWIEKDYVQWQGIPGLNQDEEEEDEESETSDDDEGGVELVGEDSD